MVSFNCYMGYTEDVLRARGEPKFIDLTCHALIEGKVKVIRVNSSQITIWIDRIFHRTKIRIGGAMVSVLAFNMVDRGFEHGRIKPKTCYAKTQCHISCDRWVNNLNDGMYSIRGIDQFLIFVNNIINQGGKF